MLLNPQVSSDQIPRVLATFLSITSVKDWNRCLSRITQRVTQNPLLAAYVAQMHAIEFEIAKVHEEISANQFDLLAATPGRYELFAFMASVVAVHEHLSPKGKNRLRGMILGGLKDGGLTSLQQEMSVATHLFSRGFDVRFSDIENGSGFDFLAVNDAVEVEVECKRVGLSLGRKVPRLETLKLHQRIQAQVEHSVRALNCGLLLRVFLPDRLSANDTQQSRIASAVGAALRSGHSQTTQYCDVQVHQFEIAGTPFQTQSGEKGLPQFRAYLEERFNVKNREVMVLGVTGKCALAISIESKKADSLLESMFAELSVSVAKQFTKTKPGILCVQFMDLTDEQIRRIGAATDGPFPQPSRLLRETSAFLSSDKRSHIHSVVFRGRGAIEARSEVVGNVLTHTVQGQGSAYFILNENHPLSKDRRYSVFGSELAPPSRVILPS